MEKWSGHLDASVWQLEVGGDGAVGAAFFSLMFFYELRPVIWILLLLLLLLFSRSIAHEFYFGFERRTYTGKCHHAMSYV